MPESRIRIGIGGWTYEPWRGSFYPAGLPHQNELAYASQHLSSIEIDGTFYRLQTAETYQKWHDDTPEDFVFSLKAPRFATRRKVLANSRDSVDRFLDSGVRMLKSKLGVINWQFDTPQAFEAADFELFLKLLPGDLKHAVEVRHDSFKCVEFVELVRQYQVAVVLSGDSEYPLIPDVTAPFVYARVMGTREANENGYSDAELDCWAARATTFASGRTPPDLPTISSQAGDRDAREVFLYVISGYKRSNPRAAVALIQRLEPQVQ